ncbi:MAG: hypothetical protein HY700_10715 [Gemmatimonadetes bacterium]|nr:hypothetical protein [Gemmatimonadota bacterium]
MIRLWRMIGFTVAAPVSAAREAGRSPSPVGTAVGLLIAVAALGALTLPRQLLLLQRALAPTGDPLGDRHHAAMAAGLVRVIVADRLVPPPTVILAVLLAVLIAEPALALAQDRHREIRAVLLFGLVPLLVQRLGEAALTYAMPLPPRLTPGFAISLPQQFVTGPAMFWTGDAAPTWVEAVSARVNLVTLWSVVLWSIGLRELDGGAFTPWHLALPALSLGFAALLTWWLQPMVLSLVLGGP